MQKTNGSTRESIRYILTPAKLNHCLKLYQTLPLTVSVDVTHRKAPKSTHWVFINLVSVWNSANLSDVGFNLGSRSSGDHSIHLTYADQQNPPRQPTPEIPRIIDFFSE